MDTERINIDGQYLTAEQAVKLFTGDKEIIVANKSGMERKRNPSMAIINQNNSSISPTDTIPIGRKIIFVGNASVNHESPEKDTKGVGINATFKRLTEICIYLKEFFMDHIIMVNSNLISYHHSRIIEGDYYDGYQEEFKDVVLRRLHGMIDSNPDILVFYGGVVRNMVYRFLDFGIVEHLAGNALVFTNLNNSKKILLYFMPHLGCWGVDHFLYIHQLLYIINYYCNLSTFNYEHYGKRSKELKMILEPLNYSYENKQTKHKLGKKSKQVEQFEQSKQGEQFEQSEQGASRDEEEDTFEFMASKSFVKVDFKPIFKIAGKWTDKEKVLLGECKSNGMSFKDISSLFAENGWDRSVRALSTYYLSNQDIIIGLLDGTLKSTPVNVLTENWTVHEQKILLSTVGDNKKPIWNLVSFTLESHGITKTATQCKHKFNNIKLLGISGVVKKSTGIKRTFNTRNNNK